MLGYHVWSQNEKNTNIITYERLSWSHEDKTLWFINLTNSLTAVDKSLPPPQKKSHKTELRDCDRRMNNLMLA